ncbi:MAG TPA: outer membrane beta-barrel protein [Vicinamibacterales bacterium]|jgi:opacity protein-like surface antigen|nr:outer membrane beta-barrel protein [Vicinamibacterales bacterium]
MPKVLITTVLVLIGAAAAPQKASADWLFTPFVGLNWGGTASFSDAADFEDEFEQKGNFGASLAYMGGGIAGFEIDFGYSPNFFQNTTGNGDFEFGDSNVTTLMANLTVGAPIGGQSGIGIRPYASGGVGIIKSRVDDAEQFFNVDSTDWGFNVGAGLAGFFTDNIGLRGDLRYFRSLQDNEPDDEFDVALSDFRFWRGTVGVTFRF